MVQLKKLMVDEEGRFGRAKTKMGGLVEERREQCGSDRNHTVLVIPQPNHPSSSFSNQTTHPRLSPAKPLILVFLQPNHPSSSFPCQTTHPCLSPAKPPILVFPQPNHPSSSFPRKTTHPRLSPAKPLILVFPQPNHPSSSFLSQTTHPRLSPAKPPIFVWMKAWMTLWVEALDKLMEVHWGIGSRSGKEWWWWRAEVRVGLPTNLLFLPQIAGQILLCPHLSSIPRFFSPTRERELYHRQQN